MSYRCWAEIDLNALRENLAWIRHRSGKNVKIMTVVKADAYGHGLKQIASLLMQSGTDIFGVANMQEARTIRSVGRGWPILLLGVTLPWEVETVVRDEVMPSLSSLDEARCFSHMAVKLKKEVNVHIKIDTGMGRLGFFPDQISPALQTLRSLPGLRIAGLYTHFSSVEDDPGFSLKQRKRFEEILRIFSASGEPPAFVHANNSGGLLFEKRSIYNTVRPGLLVYGVLPPGKRKGAEVLKKNLRPALTWKCRVGFVKEIPRGTPLSYGRSFVAPRPMKVATLTAGYGDGYLRSGSTKGAVLIGGFRCPILGRITMDQMMVDVSAVKACAPGDEAILIGRQQSEGITASEVAGWCGTVPWEVLTNITYRVPRLYRGGTAA